MIKRESYLAKLRRLKDINVIKVLTGVRRAGKSTVFLQLRDELVAEKAGNIIYYNLEEKENERFLVDADALYDQIMSEIDDSAMNYIFIDEVQMVPEFERAVDSLYVKENTDIYLTGSNAYMLSSDIATLLTGRYVEIKIQPLGFAEFVEFFADEGRDVSQLFRMFLDMGGFPEVANMLTRSATTEVSLYLNGVYDTITEKDVKKRKGIYDMDAFRRVYLYCLDNVGNVTSANNIANALSSKRLTIDRKTVVDYLQSMMDCFLLYRAERYDIRGKNILQTGEKYYTVDLGLTNALLGRPSGADVGRRIENLVFLELNRRYGQVFVGKNYGKEIDFVVRNAEMEWEYFQVSLTLAEAGTRERELAALENTGDFYRRTVLTMDPIDTDERGIRCRNLVQWLLEV